MAGPEGPAIVAYGESAGASGEADYDRAMISDRDTYDEAEKAPPGGQAGPRIVRVGRGGVHLPSAGLRATREYVPDDERLRRDRGPRLASSTKTSCNVKRRMSRAAGRHLPLITHDVTHNCVS